MPAPAAVSGSPQLHGTTPETADLGALAAHTGTPAYVIFEQTIRDRHAALARALAPAAPFRLYYSVKSNLETGVLATLRDLGCGAEISGGVERLAVQQAGFAWDRVVFDGPLKDEGELTQALSDGLSLVNIESDGELDLLRRLAQRLGRPIRIGVRVSPPLPPPKYHAVVRTYRHKFGYRLEDLERLAHRIQPLSEIEWTGLMVHIGSPVMGAQRYLTTLDQCFATAARLRQHGITINEMNLGGGLPADTMLHLRVTRRFSLARWWERFGWLQTSPPSSGAIAGQIAAHTVRLRQQHNLPVTLAFEPGRTLVASAGVMLGRVGVVKPPWVFSDISLNDLPEKLSFVEWRVAFPGRDHEPRRERWHLSGPTLATQDVLLYDHPMPRLEPGDVVAVLDTGAYSIARANQFTRPRAPVYFVDTRGRVHLIRRGETAADVLHTQQPWS